MFCDFLNLSLKFSTIFCLNFFQFTFGNKPKPCDRLRVLRPMVFLSENTLDSQSPSLKCSSQEASQQQQQRHQRLSFPLNPYLSHSTRIDEPDALLMNAPAWLNSPATGGGRRSRRSLNLHLKNVTRWCANRPADSLHQAMGLFRFCCFSTTGWNWNIPHNFPSSLYFTPP